MKVLIGCEFSGVARRAFAAKGHDAWSCDLLPSMDNSPMHIQSSVLDVLNYGWDLAIFHPPCTYLSNSGVRWLHSRPDRWDKMRLAALFFQALLHADIPRVCVENPIPHGYATKEIGRGYDQIVQPWQHGHGETKATCLWTKNLPPLVPTVIVSGRSNRIHMMPGGKKQGMRRSISYPGIMGAMAEQWGALDGQTWRQTRLI